MTKLMFGDGQYYISKDGVVTDTNGSVCTPTIRNGKVRRRINGDRHVVELDWLKYMSLFEVKLPDHLKHEWYNIEFREIEENKKGFKSDKYMVFTRPLYLDNEFRLIPNLTNLAVSIDGKIKCVITGELIKPWSIRDITKYPCIPIYDPYPSVNRDYRVHRLVALAWCDGHSPERWMVNHKDGNKHNYHAANLEWVTPSENSNHAFAEALRTDNVFTIVQDCKTWEIHSFATMSEACRWMGVGPRVVASFDFTRPSKIIKDRYEIRFGDDRTPWIYKKGDTIRAGRYTITVDLGQGDIRTYHDRRDLISDLKIWNCSGIEDTLTRGQELYPLAKFEYSDNYVNTSIQYINVKTHVINEVPTIMEVARQTGLHKSRIRSAMFVGETRSVEGYAFRYKSDIPWNIKFEDAPLKSVCIQAKHIHTNEVMIFESKRKTAEHFDKDRSIVNSRLNTNIDYEGWIFTEM